MTDDADRDTSTSLTPAMATRVLDRRISRARARLVGRLQELGRRVETARDAMNLAQVIRRHPLTAAGLGVAVGALAALPRQGSGSGMPARLVKLLGGIALQLVRLRLSAHAPRRETSIDPAKPSSAVTPGQNQLAPTPIV